MPSRYLSIAALLPLSCVCSAQTLSLLEPVVVTATRQPTKVSDVLSDVTVIDAATIRNAGPVTTLAELLGRQPGIEFKQSGGGGATSDIFIRGSNSGHVLLLIDGVRAGSLTVGTPTWESLPLEMIERIEIVRGPASSLYGSEAIAGVVQIFTRRGDGKLQLSAEAGIGTHNTTAVSAGLAGGHDGWRYSLQAADKRSDAFSAVNRPSSFYYHPDRDGYQLSSSAGSLSYATGGHEFGGSYVYSDGWDRYDGFPANADYKRQQTVSSVAVYSRNAWTSDWNSTVRIGQSEDDSRYFSNGTQSSAIQSTQTQYQWQNDIRLSLGIALLGAERVEQRVASDVAYTLKERSINSLLAGWKAGAGAHSWQLNARQDHNSQFGAKTTGMAAYGYQLATSWRANVSWGTAFKAPTFNDLYFPADSYGNVGNSALKPETSENREASLHFETASQHASLTYYRNEVKNLIQWAPIDPDYITSFGWTPSNVASATLSGWTLAYTANVGDTRLSASADLQDPQDDTLQKILIYRARQTARMAVSRALGKLGLTAEWQASGKRYADVNNTQVLGGYALVNLSATYALAPGWSLFARANNVFDKRYELSKDFATPGANLFVGIRYSPR